MDHGLCERYRYANLFEIRFVAASIAKGLTSSACIFGSSIIYVDLIVQRIPGKQYFKIQDSNSFLSSSLSLSFGVMVSLAGKLAAENLRN